MKRGEQLQFEMGVMNNGTTIMQPNIQPLYAVEAYRVQAREDSIEILAATQHIAGRGLRCKYCKTAEAAYAVAFCGHSGNMQGDDLVLAEHRIGFLRAAHLSLAPHAGQKTSSAELSLPQVGQVVVPQRCIPRSISSI